MSVIVLDPRFPGMVPVEAVTLLGGDVCYTDEVPVRIRWVVADLGGHVVDNTDVIVTTDPYNDHIQDRLDEGEELITAPSLMFQGRAQIELEAGEGSLTGDPLGWGNPNYHFEMKEIPQFSTSDTEEEPSQVNDEAKQSSELDAQSSSASTASHGGSSAQTEGASGTASIVDGEVISSQNADQPEHEKPHVPQDVIRDIEAAVALMARALRQGEWEQAQTHGSLLAYLQEESDEFAQAVKNWEAGDPEKEKALCDELSDVLLQVLFHAEIANRRGAFDIGHVAAAFVQKMRVRAPYLFEETERPVSIDEQERLWNEGKNAGSADPTEPHSEQAGDSVSSEKVENVDGHEDQHNPTESEQGEHIDAHKNTETSESSDSHEN